MRAFALTLIVALVLVLPGTILGQAISLDHVDGLNASGEIIPGEVVTFYIRLTNGPLAQSVISNGYRVYSPDGATWSPLVGTLNPIYPWDMDPFVMFPPYFDLGMYVNVFSNGLVSDTIGFGGAAGMYGTGLPANFDAVGYWITMGAVDIAHAGKTIVLDSAWYPPAGRWVWATVAENVAWDGPHTFPIHSDEPIGEAPVITSTPVTSATYGAAYTYDVEATGDPAPTFALTTAPAGMTIDAATGVISWTPDVVGDIDVVVEASNTEGTDTQAFTIAVAGIVPAFTSTPVTTGTYGVAYSYDANVSGYPAPTFALTTAPAGMIINGTTGLISWTPDVVGDVPVVVEASNVAGTAVQSFSISVAGIAPAFTSTPVTTGTYGVAYSYDADASGYPAPTFALTTAPAGMTIDAASGLVSWTPDVVGDVAVVLEASNAYGSDAQTFTITVGGIAPSITSLPCENAQYGVPYTCDVDADGYPAPTFALTTAPAGMTIDAASGLISWTPDLIGDVLVVVEASNGYGSDVQNFTIAVAGITPSFTSTPVLTGTYGVAYSYDANADGYPAPTFALTTAPAGMTVDAASGLVSWTPDDVGDFAVVIEAANAFGTDVQSFTITVTGIAPSFTSTAPLGGVVGELYTYDANADGYPAPTFALTTAPASMTIDAVSGLIGWTPAAAGDYDVVVEAANAFGSDVQSFTIGVVDAPEAPLITSTPVTGVTVNQLYTYDVEATGNPAPTFALTTAPAGMTINATSGLISWTPTMVGDYGVTVVASNDVEPDAVQSFTITVVGIAPSFTSTPVTSVAYGAAYSYDADADGIPAPTFALTTAPAGMTIDAVSGLIEWTADFAGDVDVVIEASNAFGSDVQSFKISVLGAAPSFTSTPITIGTYGVAYSYDADADGIPAPTFALTTAPAGMTIDAATGLVAWTPDDVGDFGVVIEASNAFGTDVQSFSIAVAGIAPVITTTPTTTGVVGELYYYDADATGYPAPTWSGDGNIDPVTGEVSFTPTEPGDYILSITATNAYGSDTQGWTVTVAAGPEAPVITSTPVTTVGIYELYSYNVDATGNPAPTFALTTAPAGMTIDAASGLISWTPGALGDYDVTVVASNGVDPDAVQSFTITVSGVAPSFTSTPVTSGTYGVAYSYDADADGIPAPTFALTTAPAGMTIDAASGLVAWTPDDVGDFGVVIEASNAFGTDVQSFTIAVVGIAPVITTTPPSAGVVGELYYYDADATGYPAPTWSGGDIDPVTGVLQFVPTVPGDFSITITASNDYGSDTQSWNLTVAPATEAPVITSTPVTSAVIFDAYAYDVEATGYPTPTFALSTAPAGMTIDAASGLIGWTPDALGDFDVIVVASNGVDPDAVQSFTITVIGIAPAFTSMPVTGVTVNTLYSYDADADGYPAPTFALITAPAGMTIDAATGLLEWTPDVTGTYDVEIEATNDFGVATQAFTITVHDEFQPVTFLEHDPLFINSDIIDQTVGVILAGFDVSQVDISSILIMGMVVPEHDPPYMTSWTGYTEPVLYIPFYTNRLLAHYRPYRTSIQDTYLVTFLLLDGTPVELRGDINIEINPGDLNVDGIVDNQDIDLLVNVLWNNGRRASDYEALYDVDGNGKLDPLDLRALINIVY
ncbi:MAG: putative Ig domain-containing protein [Candidatus Zixiibacteriota bacterium]